MIAARLHDEAGNVCVMLVLEPGNLEKLKQGQPIHKWLNEFVPNLPQKIELLFAYSPDVVWVAEQIQKLGTNDALKLAEIVQESLTRKPVVIRGRTAEELKRWL
jgi:hypothetical protein